MRISTLTLYLLGLSFLEDVRAFAEQLKTSTTQELLVGKGSTLPISKNYLRKLFVKNVQSIRTQLAQTVQNCITTTLSPSAVTDQPTPSPTTPAPTSVLWDQVGSDVNGNGVEEMGTNVQLDKTGSLMIVTGVNTVKMYTSGVDSYNVRTWTLKQDLSDNVSGNYLSASLGKDGSALVVGDPENGDGKALVFSLESNVWTLKVTFSGINAGDKFGYSVGIVEDGTRVVVGAPGGNYAKLFDLLGEGIFWTLVLDGYTNGFGMSIAVSQDGGFLAVGAYEDTDVVGSVYVYELVGFYVIQRFDGNIRTTNQGYSFGHSVAMNGDGTVMAIGSYEEDVVQLLRYDPNRNQYGDIGPPITDLANSNFGRSISLSSSGDKVIIGAPSYTANAGATGRAEAYTLDTSSWNFAGGYSGEAAGDEFGSSVALSGDGTTLAIGGKNNAGGGASGGHVRIFSMLD